MTEWQPLRRSFPPPAIPPPQPRKFPKASPANRVLASMVDIGVGYLVLFATVFMRVNYAISYHKAHPDEGLPGAPELFFVAVFGVALVVILVRNSVWSGQGFGKRLGRVIVAVPKRGGAASRLRCLWREFIFATILCILYFGCALMFPEPAFLNVAGVLLGGFLIVECAFVVVRADGRRIVDLLAGTQVVNRDLLKPQSLAGALP
jgi:uncharacterized RDD family membrane protein YckC